MLFNMNMMIAFFAMFNVVKGASLRESIQNELQSNDNGYEWAGYEYPSCTLNPMKARVCSDKYSQCTGSCDDCFNKGLGCFALAAKESEIPDELKGKADFGVICAQTKAISQKKVLCGPMEESTRNYWIGTAPLCGGSKSDCEENGDTYVYKASNVDEIASDYQKDKYTFGEKCWTGSKVLCQRAKERVVVNSN